MNKKNRRALEDLYAEIGCIVAEADGKVLWIHDYVKFSEKIEQPRWNDNHSRDLIKQAKYLRQRVLGLSKAKYMQLPELKLTFEWGRLVPIFIVPSLVVLLAIACFFGSLISQSFSSTVWRQVSNSTRKLPWTIEAAIGMVSCFCLATITLVSWNFWHAYILHPKIGRRDVVLRGVGTTFLYSVLWLLTGLFLMHFGIINRQGYVRILLLIAICSSGFHLLYCKYLSRQLSIEPDVSKECRKLIKEAHGTVAVFAGCGLVVWWVLWGLLELIGFAL